jgi:hypothetical protein
MMYRLLAVPGAAVAAALVAVAPAHADDRGYYDYLQSTGALGPQPWAVYPYTEEPRMIYEGHRVCDGLRSGMSRDGMIHTFDYDTYRRPPPWAPYVNVSEAIVDAAQKELCPDTLG